MNTSEQVKLMKRIAELIGLDLWKKFLEMTHDETKKAIKENVIVHMDEERAAYKAVIIQCLLSNSHNINLKETFVDAPFSPHVQTTLQEIDTYVQNFRDIKN